MKAKKKILSIMLVILMMGTMISIAEGTNGMKDENKSEQMKIQYPYWTVSREFIIGRITNLQIDRYYNVMSFNATMICIISYNGILEGIKQEWYSNNEFIIIDYTCFLGIRTRSIICGIIVDITYFPGPHS